MMLRSRSTKSDIDHLALRALLLVFITAWPVACSWKERPTISDATFFGPQGLCGFSQEQFGSVDITTVEGWIKTEFGGVSSTSQYKYGESIIMELEWRKDDESGAAWIRDNALLRVLRSNINVGFTFGDVVNAFGAPTWVYRDYEVRERVLYAVILEYPAIGFAVATQAFVPVASVEHNGSWAIQLRENIKVTDVICHVPVTNTSITAFVQEVLLTPPAGVAIQVERRVAWPGFDAWISLDTTP